MKCEWRKNPPCFQCVFIAIWSTPFTAPLSSLLTLHLLFVCHPSHFTSTEIFFIGAQLCVCVLLQSRKSIKSSLSPLTHIFIFPTIFFTSKSSLYLITDNLLAILNSLVFFLYAHILFRKLVWNSTTSQQAHAQHDMFSFYTYFNIIHAIFYENIEYHLRVASKKKCTRVHFMMDKKQSWKTVLKIGKIWCECIKLIECNCLCVNFFPCSLSRCWKVRELTSQYVVVMSWGNKCTTKLRESCYPSHSTT